MVYLFDITIKNGCLEISPVVTIYRKVNTEIQMAEYLMDKSLGDDMYVHKELPKLFS